MAMLIPENYPSSGRDQRKTEKLKLKIMILKMISSNTCMDPSYTRTQIKIEYEERVEQ